MARGWHYLTSNGLTRDGQTVEVGQTLIVKGKPVLCRRGLHASKWAIDALKYAPGSIICWVELGGKIVLDDDKMVATERTILAMADASRVLHEFACRCAERALQRERDAGREPDLRSWKALEVKRHWLKGDATAAELDAAWAAAWDAAWAAARDAAWAAARAAAWAAAWDAARAAARAAAWAAGWAAAGDAAGDAEREWQNETLTQMLRDLLGLREGQR